MVAIHEWFDWTDGERTPNQVHGQRFAKTRIIFFDVKWMPPLVLPFTMIHDLSQTERIFEFLRCNHGWNDAYQKLEYRFSMMHCDSELERLTSQLYAIAYTQSAPSLTKLGPFWRALQTYTPKEMLTLADFTAFLESLHTPRQSSNAPWERLFHALATQPGWGDKTSALFVKATIQIHRGPSHLHFLADTEVAINLQANDTLYLPVDAVIKHIFKEIGFKRDPNFQSINKFLLDQKYSADDMLIWDDLWYWGFFTQVVRNKSRYLEWNRDKFWCQRTTPKGQESEIERLAEEFLLIIQEKDTD